ncbi:hypothetical protein KY285_033300 [Solanum tuberosum]|nr:hypothetical protein KY285_033300 [Solanum tuberosum]
MLMSITPFTPFFICSRANSYQASFDGKGFPGWCRCVFIALSAKNKLGFINGTITPPDLNDAEYQRWSRCNFMITS